LIIKTAKKLVNAGPTIAKIPVLSGPIRATAAVVKKVGITVQNIAINKINNKLVVFTAGEAIDQVSRLNANWCSY